MNVVGSSKQRTSMTKFKQINVLWHMGSELWISLIGSKMPCMGRGFRLSITGSKLHMHGAMIICSPSLDHSYFRKLGLILGG